MPLKFSQLPEEIRVKLDEKGEKELWHRVDEFGGIKMFSQNFPYSSSKMYNWKNKGSYIPIQVIRQIFGNEGSEHVISYKGKSRSKPVKNPVFPLTQNEELLTRINSSVNLSQGTPIYQVKDRGLIKRFRELLSIYGEVPVKIYNRETVYELRYPKYLHKILSKMSYKEDYAALVDEQGTIEDGYLQIRDRKLSVKEFEGELYSREKALQLAIQRQDSEKVEELMKEKVSQVEKLFG